MYAYVFRVPLEFANRKTIVEGSAAVLSLAAADLDGDGATDVVLTTADGAVAWYENRPDELVAHTLSATIVDPRALGVADLDGDQDFDVLLGLGGSPGLAWFENRGGGDFGPIETLAEAGAVLALATSDVDDDGDTDVIAGLELGLSWYENAGGFDAAHTLATPMTPSALLVGDSFAGGANLLFLSSGAKQLFWFVHPSVTVQDGDGDGICDPSDQCPGHHDQLDNDGDGVPNGCDACLGAVDSDGDGAPDDCDACPGADDRQDADGDSVPDVCERCVGDDRSGDLDLDDFCAENVDGSVLDCEDLDPLVYPGGFDVAGDGLDQDCDGEEPSEVVTPEPAAVPGCDHGAAPATLGLLALVPLRRRRGRPSQPESV